MPKCHLRPSSERGFRNSGEGNCKLLERWKEKILIQKGPENQNYKTHEDYWQKQKISKNQYAFTLDRIMLQFD